MRHGLDYEDLARARNVMWFEINKITPVFHFKDETLWILNKLWVKCNHAANNA